MMWQAVPLGIDSQRPVEPIPRLLLRPSEAAKCLGMSERSLWSLTDAGTIPCVRLGRSVRYDLDVLREWVSKQRPEVGS